MSEARSGESFRRRVVFSPFPSLVRHLLLLLSFIVASFAARAAGPIRVLYLGKAQTGSAQRCPSLMQELGRDAIWFDYLETPAAATAELIGKVDVVLLD